MTAVPGTAGAPLIGITAAVETAAWGAWHQPADLSPAGYSLTVQRAGGIAVLLPPDPAVTADPGALLERLDGLILSGGADVDPGSYGAEFHPETAGTRPGRDEFELALGKGALDVDLPLLGICRGFQLMNVVAGGTLEQHLPDVVGHEGHRSVAGQFDEHEVELTEGSRIAELFGSNQKTVSSHHHQGLGRLGEGLEITGTSTGDGVAEAMEMNGRDFALAVQWHPEIDPDDLLIEALVKAARDRMTA